MKVCGRFHFCRLPFTFTKHLLQQCHLSCKNRSHIYGITIVTVYRTYEYSIVNYCKLTTWNVHILIINHGNKRDMKWKFLACNFSPNCPRGCREITEALLQLPAVLIAPFSTWRLTMLIPQQPLSYLSHALTQ
jgi:hypothetical protein